MDVLISNSEDKTVRIWDLNKKVEVDCYTNKELDRFFFFISFIKHKLTDFGWLLYIRKILHSLADQIALYMFSRL
jgi:WD40 repeat protein